jgi:hypothetical protein
MLMHPPRPSTHAISRLLRGSFGMALRLLAYIPGDIDHAKGRRCRLLLKHAPILPDDLSGEHGIVLCLLLGRQGYLVEIKRAGFQSNGEVLRGSLRRTSPRPSPYLRCQKTPAPACRLVGPAGYLHPAPPPGRAAPVEARRLRRTLSLSFSQSLPTSHGSHHASHTCTEVLSAQNPKTRTPW